MAIVEFGIKSIKDYLSMENLDIPSYQRPYKWTNRNIMQLVDDIQSFKSSNSYRIGTVVILKEDGKRLIVDGQQRTISFIVILKAILANFDKLKLSDETKEQLLEVESKMFSPSFSNDISKYNIKNNYNAVCRRLGMINDTYVEFLLKNCEVTYFTIDKISEAFQFFDSQNARGRDLDPHDLLKAFHLREIPTDIEEENKFKLIEQWENINSDELAKLFSDYLYRIRGWLKSNPSRYFTKSDVGLFKGVTINKYNIVSYPYIDIYKQVDLYLKNEEKMNYPFQLDQLIINGECFFNMIGHYKRKFDNLYSNSKDGLSETANEILKTINCYEGMNRTGDKYVRMLFDCAMLYYVDRFGTERLSTAIEKIFIWAYSLRLKYEKLQLVSVDNYVVRDVNLFKILMNTISPKELETLELESLREISDSPKTKDIKNLFKKMNYYEEQR